MKAKLQTAPETAAQSRYLHIRTFGCQMNEYDSLRVQRMLAGQGYVCTSRIEEADLIFLNTCSVREKAEQKVYSFLGRLRRLKLLNPDLKIVVAGCVAQQLGKQLLERFDYLDLVIGTRGISAFPQLLSEIEESNTRTAYLPEEESSREYDFSRWTSTVGDVQVIAPVTIMQGCNNFCTYCIVPYVRGRERSRPSGDILNEINNLTMNGVREVLLLGQNVNSYGRGLEEKTTFVDLLRMIQRETDVARIRFTTSHPKDLTEDLMQCFADLDRLCKHLHLPVQAGSDEILKRMNRGYTASRYLDRISRLRDFCPEIALSSDVMVGFPGETEAQFEDTLRLLEAVRFDTLFSFSYSDRPLTRSAEFADKIDKQTKARRLNLLQSLQADITLRRNLDEIGRVRELLVEGPSRASNGQMTGRTQQNRIVNFKGHEALVGKIVQVSILSAYSHSLMGELLPVPH